MEESELEFQGWMNYVDIKYGHPDSFARSLRSLPAVEDALSFYISDCSLVRVGVEWVVGRSSWWSL